LPLLVTFSVYTPATPTVKFPVWLEVTVRFGAVTTVGSVAVLPVVPASFGSDTVTLFVSGVSVKASCATLTVIVKLLDPEAAMAVVLVQVTVWPTALQVQPVPAELANVRPAGRVSTTVVVPVVAAVPPLFT